MEYSFQMEKVFIGELGLGIILNSRGAFHTSSDESIKKTMEEFFYGSTNLTYHF